MSVIKIADSITLFGLLVNMLSIKVEESHVKRVGLVIGGTEECSCRQSRNKPVPR